MKSAFKKNVLPVLCLVIYFSVAGREIWLEAGRSLPLFRTAVQTPDEALRARLLGADYRYARLLSRIVPESAHVLFFTNAASNAGSANLQINYAVYPRKLFAPVAAEPLPPLPPDPALITAPALGLYDIAWLAYRYTEPLRYNRIIRLERGRPAACFELDPAGGTYARCR